MRLRIGRAPLSLILPPTLYPSNGVRLVSCSSIEYSPASPKPQTPLFLRSSVFSATLSDLRKWQNWAKTLASSVGSSFLDQDKGPDSDLLHRELNWLIEDLLEDPKLLQSQFNTSIVNEGILVKLRADLEDLYVLWKQRIEDRRPFQYIVGCEHWRDLVLSVQEGVLIPRPETELIVDLVADVIKDNEELREGLWADLGTGSGALAIGIARILGSRGKVVATDLSMMAVTVASFNVRRYNLQDKVVVKQGSWFKPLKDAEGELAGLISNPPYVPSEHICGLQAEVGKHEPRLALDGGEDGMDDLLYISNGAASMLKAGGFFAFETNGENQSKLIVDQIETKSKGSFYGVDITSDFAGVRRFVTGFRA